MDLEIQRVARELYKAFSGLNEEFERPQDQVGLGKLWTKSFVQSPFDLCESGLVDLFQW